MTPARFTAAVAAATLLGAGVAGCGSQRGTAAGRPTPPKLHLSTSASVATSIPGRSTVPYIVSPGPPGVPGWARIELAGKLPGTGPATGAIRPLQGGAAALATVRALARALGLSGQPSRVGGGWRVTGPGTLWVADSAGQRWTFLNAPIVPRCYGPGIRRPPYPAAAGAGGPAARPGTLIVACPMKPGELEPYAPLPGGAGTGAPSADAAKAAARPLLQATGLAAAPLRLTTIGSYTFVSADPVVAGLPTAGFDTTVGVGPGNRIQQASGWLAQPATPGPSYPLISAQQAFNRLKSTHPGSAARPPEVMCPLSPDTLCGGPGPVRVVKVTGAVHGLALSYNRNTPVLVPAWLFSVAGAGLRIPQIAINPRYLGG